MSRVARVIVNPQQPQSIVDNLYQIQKIVDGDVGFGNPQNPFDSASTAWADGVVHNGTLENISGSWVELDITAPNTNVNCIHNLGVQVLSASEPNVRWLVFGWQHDNAGAGAGSTATVLYVDGAVTSNSIELRFFASTRTVDGAHPLRVCLFFIPAVRGIAIPLPV